MCPTPVVSSLGGICEWPQFIATRKTIRVMLSVTAVRDSRVYLHLLIRPSVMHDGQILCAFTRRIYYKKTLFALLRYSRYSRWTRRSRSDTTILYYTNYVNNNIISDDTTVFAWYQRRWTCSENIFYIRPSYIIMPIYCNV